jgi:hypothetical protein
LVNASMWNVRRYLKMMLVSLISSP